MEDAATNLPDEDHLDSDDEDSAVEDMTAMDKADFELELARMMSETRVDSKPTGTLKNGVSDINISAIKRHAQQKPVEEASSNGHMSFVFLTKKGVKHQVSHSEMRPISD